MAKTSRCPFLTVQSYEYFLIWPNFLQLFLCRFLQRHKSILICRRLAVYAFIISLFSLPVTLRIRLEAGIGQCTTAASGFLSLPEKAQSHPYHSSDDKYGHERILYGEVYVYCKCHYFFFFFGDDSSGLPILRFELSFKTFIVISEIICFNWDMNSPAL